MASYQTSAGRDAPSRLGRYELLGHLATGGMAEIHLARLAGEAGFEKVVVVKRLLPELVASPAYVAMFLDEGKLVSRLDHPNICEVHELARDGADYYLAMPYLDGVSVHELIGRPRDPDRRGELRVAAGIAVQACEGLHHAHELRDADGAPAGLVHRDVSPSNLFVTSRGVVKVLDFGIAKVRGAAETEAGTIKGKQQYMAPEQLLGEPLDRRCDLFALGIVLFELASHQRLFKRPSDYLAARAILEDPIPRADAIDPAIPAALADVIARLLVRDPAGRYADAREVAAAITHAMASHGGLATPAEIAATVTSTDELSAQRTRQARVLDEAKQHAVSGIATRPLRSAAPPTIVDRRPSMLPVWIAVAVTLAVIAGFVWWRMTRDDAQVQAVALAPDASPGSAQPDVAPMRDGVDSPLPVAQPDAAPTRDRVDGVAGKDRPPARDRPTNKTGGKSITRATGLFSIDSTPYATIYVDGAKLGVTPIVKRPLAAGSHRLRAVLEDGRVRELTVDISAGRLAQPIQLTWP
ncbi:MAG TPA: serine/threonine-protein kinase [Kofleriaceae bacterium]